MQMAVMIALTIVAVVAVAEDSTPLLIASLGGLGLTAAVGWVFTPTVIER